MARQQHLLNQLQDDILELRPLSETRELWPASRSTVKDRSIRFHIAHSPQREVEILHDQLLARFSADPTLRPRDVSSSCCPAIDTYAPHIRAVFGQLNAMTHASSRSPSPTKGQRGRDPLLIAVEHLLKLPDSRFAVSEVLDLLDVPAVRARFGIRERPAYRCTAGSKAPAFAGASMPSSGPALGLPEGLEQNSWRLACGACCWAMRWAVGERCDGIEPYDEIGGLDAALIGPLVALLDALEVAHQALSEPATVSEWGSACTPCCSCSSWPRLSTTTTCCCQLQDLRETWLERASPLA
ncbi:hypothetical protein [Pseudomonas peli]|uniref:hypothetical protein n=1 Tax=Pseudomonas peli TaxID=592361 RepID=UPI003D15D104